ncbi:MAG: YajQ family cyclic di-GMP-binding protein [Acidobacteriota bacterium]
MAASESFDISSQCDLQEVDNAVNQAVKEVGQRYDFRGLKIGIDFQRKENQITLTAPDEYKIRAVYELLQGRLVRRGVPVRNLRPGKLEASMSGQVRQTIDLQQGIPTDTCKAIVKFLKGHKLKKVQASIQGDQVRVSSPSRDVLQEVIQLLKQEDFGLELEFGNYRS